MKQQITTNAAPVATITGRDGYILDKALIYAIAHIQSLPEHKRERSDMEDMCALAKASGSPFILQSLLGVEWHTGIKAELWPQPDDELSEREKAERDQFRSSYDAFSEMIRKGMEECQKANAAFGLDNGNEAQEAA